MDALAGLLDGPRARGAFLLRVILDAPWSLLVQDEAPLTVICMVRGDGWITAGSGDAVHVRPGDVALVRGPEHYVMADDPATQPRALVLPGGRATTLTGEELCEKMLLGVRTWGKSLDGAAVMLIGTYQMQGEINQRLLRVLPGLLVLPGDEWQCPVVPLLADEIVKDEPGQEVVLDRLLDLLLIALLRTWFSRTDGAAPGWYRAHGDPVVGRALQLLHDNPGYPWTVAILAAKVGVSRAALARRFTDLVGEPPMSYLTGWRLALAADLLREPDSTIEAVARWVGYGSAFALSAAFKRVHGLSPREHRRGAL